MINLRIFRAERPIDKPIRKFDLFLCSLLDLAGKRCSAIPTRSVARPVVDDLVPISIALRGILTGGVENGCTAVVGVGKGRYGHEKVT